MAEQRPLRNGTGNCEDIGALYHFPDRDHWRGGCHRCLQIRWSSRSSAGYGLALCRRKAAHFCRPSIIWRIFSPGRPRMNPLPDRGMLYFFLAGDDLLWGTPWTLFPSKYCTGMWTLPVYNPAPSIPMIFPGKPALLNKENSGSVWRRHCLMWRLPEKWNALWYDLMDQNCMSWRRGPPPTIKPSGNHCHWRQTFLRPAGDRRGKKPRTGCCYCKWIPMKSWRWPGDVLESFLSASPRRIWLTGRFDETCLVIQRD